MTKSLTIYCFAAYYPNPYAPYLDSELAFLLRRGHSVRVFSIDRWRPSLSPVVAAAGLREEDVVHYPTEPYTALRYAPAAARRAAARPGWFFRQMISAGRSVKRRRDLVPETMRRTLLSAGSPDVCYFHDLASHWWMKQVAVVYPEAAQVLHFHGGVPSIYGRSRPPDAFASMDLVLTNTQYSARQAVALGCPPEKIVIRPMGLDPEDYPATSPRTYRKDGMLNLVSVGRLVAEKGHGYALEAMRALLDEGLSAFRYRIVGWGEEERKLRTLVSSLGLTDHVAFCGELTKEQVVGVLSESDALLLPSVPTSYWEETQAVAVQEAMLMRLVVVTSLTGGVPESIPEAMKSFAVPPAEPEALLPVLRRLCQMPQNEWKELGQIARDWTLERYDMEVTGQTFLDAVSRTVRRRA